MIEAHAGTITQIALNYTQVVTPEQCFNMGHDCIVNLLCKASICIEQNGSLLLMWIW